MTKRIHWAKGMRLTDTLLRKSDELTLEMVGRCLRLAVNGCWGILPKEHFEVSLGIQQEDIDIYELRCVGLTKSGFLIDIELDGTSPTGIIIPDATDTDALLLYARVLPGDWKDAGEDLEEPPIGFELIPANYQVNNPHVLPIARLVKSDEGWEQDTGFIPPLLSVNSHPRMMELLERYVDILKATDIEARRQLTSEGHVAISIFWPVVRQLLITMDKERDGMTPKQFLGHVQKYVSAFVCATEIDPNLQLGNAELYYNYASVPYGYSDVTAKIEEGLQLCYDIKEKLQKLQAKESKAETIATPVIHEKNRYVNCKSNTTQVPVDRVEQGATVLFTTNGKKPSSASAKAKRDSNGRYYLEFANDFKPTADNEPDKHILISVAAMRNDALSEVGEYEVTLHKDSHFIIKKKHYGWEI